MKPHAQRIIDAVRTINDLALLRQDALRRLAASLDFKGCDPATAYYAPDSKWYTKGPVLHLELKGGLERAATEYAELAMVDGGVIVDNVVTFLVRTPRGYELVLLDFDKRVSPSEDIRSIARAKWGANLKVTFELDFPWYMAEGARVYIHAKTSSDFDYVELADCAPVIYGEHVAFLIKGHVIYVLDFNKRVDPR